MSVSVFDSVSLTMAVNDLDSAQRASRIMRLFRPNPTVHVSKYLEYGYDSDNPHILQVRKQHEGSSPIAATLGTLKRLTFPKYRPSFDWDEIDAQTLDPAVAAYTGTASDPTAVQAQKIAKHLGKLRRRIETSHLVNCMTALRTGAITFQYEDATTEGIEYGYGSAGTAVTSIIKTALSGTTAPTAIWTHANALPMDNIELLARNIRATSQYGGAFDVLMGPAAWDAFRVHSTVTNQLDNRRIDSGGLMFRENNEYKGSINGFDIYEVDYRYLLNTTWTEAWDTNTIAVVPREDLDWFSTEYGAIWEIPEGANRASFIPTQYFSKVIVEQDPVSEKLIVESRPIPLIKNPLCLRVQTVIS